MIECIGADAHRHLGKLCANSSSWGSYVKKVEVTDSAIHWTVSGKPGDMLRRAIFAASNTGEWRDCFIHILDARSEATDDVTGTLNGGGPWSRGVIALTLVGHVEVYTTDADSGSIEHKIVVVDNGKRTAFVISFGAEWEIFKRVLGLAMDACPM